MIVHKNRKPKRGGKNKAQQSSQSAELQERGMPKKRKKKGGEKAQDCCRCAQQCVSGETEEKTGGRKAKGTA